MKDNIKAEIERLEKLFKNDLSKEQKKVILKDFCYRIEEIIEQPELKVGQWFKGTGKSLVFLIDIDIKDRPNGKYITYYGLDYNGIWFNEETEFIRDCSINKTTPATDKEVEEALTREAKKRGLKINVATTSLISTDLNSDKITGYTYIGSGMNSLFGASDGCGGACLFKDGQWAEAIEEPEKKAMGRFLDIRSLPIENFSTSEIYELQEKIINELKSRH